MGQTFSSAWVTNSAGDLHFLGPRGALDLALSGLHWDRDHYLEQAGNQDRRGRREGTAPLGFASLGLLTLDHMGRVRHGYWPSHC